MQLFTKCSGRTKWPASPSREAWVVAGRRSGKSFFMSLLATYFAVFRKYKLSAGESGHVIIVAPTKPQAVLIREYILGFFHENKLLRALLVKENPSEIVLKNRVSIVVLAGDFKVVRGYTAVAVIIDEIAFIQSEGVSPDTELLRALRPTLATTEGPLVCISSPYAKRGELYKHFRKHYGKDDNPVFVWQSDSLTMNPTLSKDAIDRAREDDPAGAASEWDGLFRSDVAGFFPPDSIEAFVRRGYQYFDASPSGPSGGVGLPDASVPVVYTAYVDTSGGSVDSMVLAVAHTDMDGMRVLDLVDERRPPFSPEAVVAEFAAVLREYGLTEVTGDKYAGDWVSERFAEHGINYRASDKPKSEMYLDLLALVNSRKIVLPDNDRLVSQLIRLERRPSRSGRDLIDHPTHEHDDCANAAAGALVACEVQPSFTGNALDLLVTQYPGGVPLLDKFQKEFPFD